MKVVTKIHYVLDETDRKSIKKQMIDLDLSLRKMAENLGVSAAYLSSTFKGERYFTPKLKKQLESQGIVFKEVDNAQD